MCGVFLPWGDALPIAPAIGPTAMGSAVAAVLSFVA
jgi:hypothetical protein